MKLNIILGSGSGTGGAAASANAAAAASAAAGGTAANNGTNHHMPPHPPFELDFDKFDMLSEFPGLEYVQNIFSRSLKKPLTKKKLR